jgi:hypothetical protein
VFGRPSLRSPFEQARKKRNDQESEEDEKQYLRYAGRCTGDAAETKRAGDDRNDEKYERPVKHDASPSNDAIKTWVVAVCSHPLPKKTELAIRSAAGRAGNSPSPPDAWIRRPEVKN